MTSSTRWFPRLTLAVAGAHVVTAAALYGRTYRDMVAHGLVGTADGRDDREAAVWFLAAAPALAGLGLASRWSIAETGRIPPPVPLTLLGLGAFIAVVSPISGGWALIALGAWGVADGRPRDARAGALGPPST